MRIAFCLPKIRWLHEMASAEFTNAASIQQGYIATGLRSRGHILTYLAPRNLDQMVCTRDPSKVSVAPQTWSNSRAFDIAGRSIWRVQRWIGIPYLNIFSNYRRFDACLQCLPGHDLVYERNGLYNVAVAMACRRLKIPYILFFDADEILEYDFIGKPIAGLLRWRARQAIRYNLSTADRVICVSNSARDQLVTSWNVIQNKIVVFPNAVDVEKFKPDPTVRAEARTSLGVNAQPLVIFVGSFYKWHDVSTLLDAFARVLVSSPDARLVLVGDGTGRESMTNRASELGLGDKVQFTGAVSHTAVSRLLAAADVAVVPYPLMVTKLWLSPLKLFEYMASGTAIIASAVGQLTEVVQDGSNGLLVPPGDSRRMTAALQRLISDPILRSKLAQQAREDAIRLHSWEGYLSRLERLFFAIARREPASLFDT